MKKNMIQKAIASVTAILAVSAMTVPAAVSAVNTPTINKEPAVVIQTPTDTAAIPVNKDIVLFNVDGSLILSPNITYSYDITPAAVSTATITTYAPGDLKDDGITPKDGTAAITVKVKPGVIGAITTANDNASTADVKEASISFGAEGDTNTNDNTTKHKSNKESDTTVILSNKVSSSMTINVDANKIYDTNGDGQQDNGPGVYRYKIKDVTTDATLTASGIERKYQTDNNDTIYLDVYTKYNEQKNGLVVYGYVLLKDTNDKDNVDINYYTETTIPETLKITGFDTDSENTDTYKDQTVAKENLTSDAYHTYNVEVQKKTDGDLADTQNNFPFTIALSNENVKLDDFFYEITKDGQKVSARTTSLGEGKLTDTEFNVALSNSGAWTLDGSTASTNLQLQNGDKILITGLPVGTKITVTETNNTDDVYTVSATNLKQAAETGTDAITLKIKDGEQTGTSLSVDSKKAAEMNAALEIKKSDAGDVIVFTNTLKDISVTGLLFSIAPFAAITAAGALLLGLFMKNKKRGEDKNRI